METVSPIEYIQKQIFVAGKRSNISAIQYYDDSFKTYCPFCGAEQVTMYNKETRKYETKCKDECEGYKNEQIQLGKISNIKTQINLLQEELLDVESCIKESAIESGTKVAAKHYLSKSDEIGRAHV